MLRLTYRAQTSVPVEVESLLPERLRELPLTAIERLPIQHGNGTQPLAEFFAVTGDPGDGRLEFMGDLAGVHWIGAKMRNGEIRVAGDAGRHVGSEMSGGCIRVEGSASDWVGGEMRGGRITITGNAGNLVGSAYRGSPRGMTGGEISVHGDVGQECGHSMRRGMLAVGGACGDFPVLNMIAGNMIVFGQCGERPAAGMRRGTLALLGSAPPLLPTFSVAGNVRPVFMRMLLRMLAQRGFPGAGELLESEYLAHTGDLLTVGRGEILIRSDD